MMSLMQRRREMMERELYPIGTDILTYFFGEESNRSKVGRMRHYVNISTGEIKVHAGQIAFEHYIPVKSSYRFRKENPNSGRSGVQFACYDINKEYIYGWNSGGSWGDINLPKLPSDTAYIRLSYYFGNKGTRIIRIA